MVHAKKPGLASRREITWGNDAKKGRGNPNFSGGKYVDDKGYIRVLKTDHPFNNKGYVYEHRLVMEEYLGRFLQPWEIIHHINEIKLDNRIDNFFLTTSPEHSIIHREGSVASPKRRSDQRAIMKERNSKRKKDSSGRFVKSDD